MERYLEHITEYLLGQSWQIAVLVCAVATVSWLLRNRSAHVRYLLWEYRPVLRCVITKGKSGLRIAKPEAEVVGHISAACEKPGWALNYRDRLGSMLENTFSSVAEQEHTLLDGESELTL